MIGEIVLQRQSVVLPVGVLPPPPEIEPPPVVPPVLPPLSPPRPPTIVLPDESKPPAAVEPAPEDEADVPELAGLVLVEDWSDEEPDFCCSAFRFVSVEEFWLELLAGISGGSGVASGAAREPKSPPINTDKTKHVNNITPRSLEREA